MAASLIVCVTLAACAGAARGPEGPVVSPTGKVYEPGTPPDETRQSQTASLYLRRDRVERALELAREGIEEHPGNPVHYFLAGVAHARLGQYERADSMFLEAERIYPAYELDIEPEREAAWAEAFNRGTDAYAQGDPGGAISAWRDATTIYDLRPEAHRNLASLLAEEGRYGEAIEVYRAGLEGLETRPASRVLGEEEVQELEEAEAAMERSLAQLLLFRERYAQAEPLLRRQLQRDSTSVRARSDLARALAGMGEDREAGALYSSLLAEDELEATQLFNLGVALFRAGRPAEAADAFDRLTELRPNSRDAWFNYANALFAAEAWSELSRIGDRLLSLDPLGESSALIVARAELEAGDAAAARTRVQRTEEAPVHVDRLQMQPSGARTTIRGRVVGNVAEPGAPVRLRFLFYAGREEVGRRTVDVRAPAPDESIRFEVVLRDRASGYRYELVP